MKWKCPNEEMLKYKLSTKMMKRICVPPRVAAENNDEADNGGARGGEDDGQAGVGAGWYNRSQPISLVLLATLPSSWLGGHVDYFPVFATIYFGA